MGAESEVELFKVASATPVDDLGSVISRAVYDGKRVVLRAIGAGAISQAMKATAVARGFVAPRGIDLSVVPGFVDIMMPSRTGGPDEKMTGMVFKVVVN